jgi:hypothetical protein
VAGSGVGEGISVAGGAALVAVATATMIGSTDTMGSQAEVSRTNKINIRMFFFIVEAPFNSQYSVW